MVDLVTFAVNWLLISALYALVAIGFTMIFGVGGVLNLAHGGIVTIGAFAAYGISAAGYSIWLAALAALAAGGLFSAVLYVAMIRKVADEPIMVMILTLVTAVIIEEAIRTFVTTQDQAVPVFLSGRIPIGSTSVQSNMVLMFVVSWLLIGGLLVFVNYTETGKAILATSMSSKGAAVVGIDSNRINLYTWIIAGVLAAVAGVFLAMELTANYQLGRRRLVLAFSIVVLGGLGSIRGSVAGAYLIGFLEVGIQAIEPSLVGVPSLVVLVLILLVKPEGLFGREFTD